MSEYKISLKEIFRRHKLAISFTLTLVILENAFEVLFPLFIGYAINDILKDSYDGLYLVAILGIGLTITGGLRRSYDTRVYSKIYRKHVSELVDKEFANESSVSKVSARANMLTGLVEYFENAVPMILASLISLAGTLIILFGLNFKIFLLCIVASVLIALVFYISSGRIYKHTSNYNNEHEKQVTVLETKEKKPIDEHFFSLMKWNIKLSDIETVNFSLSFIIFTLVIGLAIIFAVKSGITEYGTIFSIILYVFQYLEGLMILPLNYQEYVKLSEVVDRLNDN